MATITGHLGTEQFECQTCGAAFAVEYYVCPACGGFSVERPW